MQGLGYLHINRGLPTVYGKKSRPAFRSLDNGNQRVNRWDEKVGIRIIMKERVLANMDNRSQKRGVSTKSTPSDTNMGSQQP